MASTLEPFDTFPGIANGALDQLYLHQANMQHDLAGVQGFEFGLRRMNQRYGRRYQILFVSHQRRAASPPEEIRSRFISTLRNQAILPSSGALAILSPGLIGATGRSIVTGILMAARLPFLVRVFGTVPDAYQFLVKEGQRDSLTLPRLSDVEAALAMLSKSAELAAR